MGEIPRLTLRDFHALLEHLRVGPQIVGPKDSTEGEDVMRGKSLGHAVMTTIATAALALVLVGVAEAAPNKLSRFGRAPRRYCTGASEVGIRSSSVSRNSVIGPP